MYIMGNAEVEAVRRVIMSGRLFRYTGKESETLLFEKEWAKLIGAPHALAVTSGTAALICGLVGMGVGPGDEVVVPGYTFMASALAPLAVGAVPIIAEIDESMTLDPKDVERKISRRTKAIMPVHMCGLPADMGAIMRVARRHDLKVLEDACQADGGSYRGRRLGSIGHAGAFSFNFFKIVVCGEGGALTTSDRNIYERAMIYHDGGCIFRGHKGLRQAIFAGCNFRMNDILSAVLRVQMRRLGNVLAALRREKRLLMREMAGEKGFSFNPRNDPKGDCGTTLGLFFETRERAGEFVASMKESGFRSWSPINSDKHVYVNWEPVMRRRGAHHPALDAFRLSGAKIRYSPDMCPKTLDILGRTVYLDMKLRRPKGELRKLIAAVKLAAR